MKVKYLKVMHNANIGEVKEVTEFEANILIKTGVAQECKARPKTNKSAVKIEKEGK